MKNTRLQLRIDESIKNELRDLAEMIRTPRSELMRMSIYRICNDLKYYIDNDQLNDFFKEYNYK
jgi:hypothetical protein